MHALWRALHPAITPTIQIRRSQNACSLARTAPTLHFAIRIHARNACSLARNAQREKARDRASEQATHLGTAALQVSAVTGDGLKFVKKTVSSSWGACHLSACGGRGERARRREGGREGGRAGPDMMTVP